MQPWWSSIWLLLIRAPLWQRNFPLLRQFELFTELQRTNRHPDTHRGSFCSGWRAARTTALGGQKVWMVILNEGHRFWNGSLRPQGELGASHFSYLWPVCSEDTNTWKGLCILFSILKFRPICQCAGGWWHAINIPGQNRTATLQVDLLCLWLLGHPKIYKSMWCKVKELQNICGTTVFWQQNFQTITAV